MSSTAGAEHHDATKPAGGTASHVAQHAASAGRHRSARATAEHALHVGKHVVTLVALHVVALGVLDKTPLLAVLSLR